ncbi:MAG: ferrous iron transport protein A [Pirellulaceae bacterium]|nr:ferrous iron transport protein A [Pirellulaceae bacterium]
MIPLDLLTPGEVGRVVAVDGDHDLVVRLAEMGVRVGIEVLMLRQGSPCILAIENRRVSFRGDNVASILVEPVRELVGGTPAGADPKSTGCGVPGTGSLPSAAAEPRPRLLARWLGA